LAWSANVHRRAAKVAKAGQRITACSCGYGNDVRQVVISGVCRGPVAILRIIACCRNDQYAGVIRSAEEIVLGLKIVWASERGIYNGSSVSNGLVVRFKDLLIRQRGFIIADFQCHDIPTPAHASNSHEIVSLRRNASDAKAPVAILIQRVVVRV